MLCFIHVKLQRGTIHGCNGSETSFQIDFCNASKLGQACLHLVECQLHTVGVLASHVQLEDRASVFAFGGMPAVYSGSVHCCGSGIHAVRS